MVALQIVPVAGLALQFLSGLKAPATIEPKAIEYNKLGKSDLVVSNVCLGTMTWGKQNTDEEADAQLNRAWELGCNFLDTAEIYPIPVTKEKQGATDRAIAKWMQTNGRARDEVVIATKVAGYNERFTWMRGGPTRVSREQIFSSVDASLARLGVDHLDLLQIHWPDRYVPMFGSTRYDADKEREDAVTFDEQARAMAELVAAGKIRAWGLSNETPLGVTEFVAAAAREGAPPPASVQNGYNLLQRNDENGLLEAMRHHGVSYLPYSPLSAGVLSGKYNQQPGYLRTRPPAGSRMTLFDGYFDKYALSCAPLSVDAYMEMAEDHGLSPSALAIAFCDSRPYVTSTIIGAMSVEQLEDNMAGFGVHWTEAMEAGVAAIDASYPDPWRMTVRGGG